MKTKIFGTVGIILSIPLAFASGKVAVVVFAVSLVAFVIGRFQD